MTTGPGHFGYENVSNDRAQELMRDPNVAIIDVRDDEKFGEATLDGESFLRRRENDLDRVGRPHRLSPQRRDAWRRLLAATNERSRCDEHRQA